MTTTEHDRARMRAYYRANREKILAYNKAYRKAHPEKWAYKAATSTEMKLKRSAYYRKYYAEHREEIKANQNG